MADTVIGFSGFDLYEECYEYCKNACHIADTNEGIERLMKNSISCVGEYRVDPVTRCFYKVRKIFLPQRAKNEGANNESSGDYI